MSDETMRKLDRVCDVIFGAVVAAVVMLLLFGDAHCSVSVKSEPATANTPAR